jgi:hypothetical protein
VILAVVAAAALQLGIGPTPAPTPAPGEVVLASPRVVVPMTYTRKRIVIQATINGAGPFSLLLNSSARLALSPEALAAARIPLVDQPMPTPSATTTPAVTPAPLPKIAVVPLMDIEGVQLKNITAVANWKHGALDGTIGYPLFARLRSRIDVRAATITFSDPANDTAPLTGSVLPMEIKRAQMPAVEGVVDGIAGVFILDTTSSSSLILTSPFVTSHTLYTRTTGSAATDNPGDTRFLESRPLPLMLGSMALGPVPTQLSTANTGIWSDPYAAGLIGMSLLERYIVTLDFPNGQIAFEKYP